MDDDKRQLRQLKREVKKAGNRKRRRLLQRDLERNPEDAAYTDIDLGNDTSEPLNGIDRDSTRRGKFSRDAESSERSAGNE
jgi:hypothetical protein